MNKTFFRSGAIAAVGLLFLAQTSSANLINITENGLPDYIVSVTGGNIAPKTTSQGDEQMFEWLQVQVGSAGYPDVADVLLASGTSISGIDFSVWTGHYLVLHWGTGQANKLFDKADKPKGGFDQAFYIAPGFDNTFELPSLMNTITGTTKNVGGLSFWRVYDPPTTVPDAASTLGLLALAFCLILLINNSRNVNRRAFVRTRAPKSNR